jgi:hypothetical protein
MVIVQICVFVISITVINTLVSTFMHDIYNYMPKINHIYRVYSVAAVPYLQLVLHV